MILIIKGNEPSSLTKYRKTPFAYFDGFDRKEEIRDSLLKDQGYLCAYCMRRIDRDDTRIEHWKPESQLTESEKLDYSNMLAVCYKPSEGKPERLQTCDTRKGQTEIMVDPRIAEHIDAIAYRIDSGIIYSKNMRIDADLNEALNLNCSEQYLPGNRQAVLTEVIRKLRQRQKTGNWKVSSIAALLKMYEEPDSDGRKREYAGIVIWYLRKKLKRLSDNRM